MVEWSEHLFGKLATEAGFGPTTREACRRVLVPHELPDGAVGVEKQTAVAKDMGLFDSHISRAVRAMRQKLVELGDLSEERDFRVARTVLTENLASDRDLAISNARQLYGEELPIRDAESGQTYIGSPLVKTPGHVVQVVPTTTGREGIMHKVSNLQLVPNMTHPLLTIAYPSQGGLAEVRETMPAQVRGGRSR